VRQVEALDQVKKPEAPRFRAGDERPSVIKKRRPADDEANRPSAGQQLPVLAKGAASLVPRGKSFDYFSELLIEVNLLLRLVPKPFTATMIAIEMPAAIRPYSMAVAPDSSLQNLERSLIVLLALICPGTKGCAQFREHKIASKR
jgi:hypothetical protein